MHIRITAVPPRRAIDGLDLSGLQVGSTYLLATRLATYLVDGGFAESTESLADSVTACGAPMIDAVSGDAHRRRRRAEDHRHQRVCLHFGCR
jgi:hypothetical protein